MAKNKVGEKGRAAVFLDRDGTINEEVGYLDRMEKLRLLPGAAAAIRRLNESGLLAVVVTNQSGVARGLFGEAFVDRVHARLREMLRPEGARIDAFYFCPHHPTGGMGAYLKTCDCRKPAPGMLLSAARELQIDLNRSWIIGDTLKDVEAGARAGAQGILVRTGYGEEAVRELGLDKDSPQDGAGLPDHPPAGEGGGRRETEIPHPVKIAQDLREAADWIIERQKGRAR